MKYWLKRGFNLTNMNKWKLLGISAHIYSNLGDRLITLKQWANWRETSSITKAAKWIETGFTPDLVVKWMDNNISPRDAKILKDVIYPMEAAKWLTAEIPAKLATC
ncbi:hypothetical protein DSO57_1025531 [Entomophthora muscae]|uniref:Uncharacterized protein n=1 Tax=Entomophthora muscae TaxID=34485 RepID=A0ACC2TD73_9FUNG|nr:hypothetical protein DSO57_1025531 [Entomophthora muscae]